jgi:hypothetical protein
MTKVVSSSVVQHRRAMLTKVYNKNKLITKTIRSTVLFTPRPRVVSRDGSAPCCGGRIGASRWSATRPPHSWDHVAAPLVAELRRLSRWCGGVELWPLVAPDRHVRTGW